MKKDAAGRREGYPRAARPFARILQGSPDRKAPVFLEKNGFRRAFLRETTAWTAKN